MTGGPATASRSAAVAIEHLTIVGPSGPIVRSVSLSAATGETVAIVGESGSGKSMTARAITGLLPSGVTASGTLQLEARPTIDLAAATERVWRGVRGTGIVLLLQDPFTSLAPVRRVGAQIADTLRAHHDPTAGPRPTRARMRAIVAERLAEVRLPERVARQYPHELSGGMRQRVALAAALAADPAVLVADEPTTALDASTQGEILSLINRVKAERGMSVILISHDLELVRGHADAIEVLFGGSVVERGPAALVLSDPAHPYTAGLLAASPSIEHRRQRLPTEPWIELERVRLAPGTTFGDGYTTAEGVRAVGAPRLVDIGDGRAVAVYDEGLPRPTVPSAPALAPGSERADPTTDRSVVAAAPRLRVVDLRKRFGDQVVLDGVSFEAAAGEIVGIVGESGSGKTTIARCIVGLESWDSGTIEPAPGGRGRGAGRVQIVFQDPASALNPAHTVERALLESLRVAGDSTTAPADLLRRVGIPVSMLRRRPRALSGGQRQRVAIARALALRPEVLLCDESVSALDVSVQAQILALLQRLRDEEALAIVFISHDLGVIHQIADRVVVLDGGVVVETGTPEQVLGAPEHPYTAHLVAAARRTSAPAPAPAPEEFS